MSRHCLHNAAGLSENWLRLPSSHSAPSGTTVADLEALADEVCTSLDDFPLTTAVLGCTVFEDGEACTTIREGLRQDDPARHQFALVHELSEILTQRYPGALPDQSRREHVCDAFAPELLLPHAGIHSLLPLKR